MPSRIDPRVASAGLPAREGRAPGRARRPLAGAGPHRAAGPASPAPAGTMAGALERVVRDYGALSPELRKAAQYVVDHPNEVGVASIRQLAAAAGVRPSTLVRMARALGFRRWEAFRHPFREVLRRGVDSFPDRARWLQSLAQGGRHGQLLARMAEAITANVEAMFSAVVADDLKVAAERLRSARRAYVLGLGSCYSLAHGFYYVARMALDHLVLVPQQAALPLDDLARVGRGDAVLVMTFRPYRRETVDAARLARERGAAVIAITDSPTSPVAAGAEGLFVVPAATPQFFPSMAATLALLETLLAFLVAGSDRRAVERIAAFDRERREAAVYWVGPREPGGRP